MAVPASVRELGSLSRVDYSDRFSLSTAVSADPERWARAMFGDVPNAGERFIWRGLLGLRLEPSPSPGNVAGWPVDGRGEDWVRLATASRSLSCNLIVQAAAGRVSLVTLMRYDRLPGRLAWTPLSAVHRRLAPGLLRSAEARLR